MPSPLNWIRIRFASRLAAQQTANEILQYLYTMEDPEECEGDNRLVMWSSIAFCPEPVLYLNDPAIQLAERLRLQLPTRETVAASQLPSPRTLLFGLPTVDLLH